MLRTISTKLGLIRNRKVEMKDNYEFSVKSSILRFVLNFFTSLELFAIKNNVYIPFGSSILAVFEKK